MPHPTGQVGAVRRRTDPRQDIVDAASAAFIAHGYAGMNLDEVTSGARVSKQTVYRLFGNKAGLFGAVIRTVTDSLDTEFTDGASRLRETDDLEADLLALARRFLRLMMRPDALRLRRLVIAEADRFPELCRLYQQRGPERVQEVLAGTLTTLVDRGLLDIDDPQLAAVNLSWTIMSQPVNTAMFCGSDTPFSEADLDRCAVGATRLFLAAYGTGAPASTPAGTRPL